MPEKDIVGLEKILDHLEVQKVTNDPNSDLVERFIYQPPISGQLSKLITALKEDGNSTFRNRLKNGLELLKIIIMLIKDIVMTIVAIRGLF